MSQATKMEQWASEQHAIWSHWMQDLFSVCDKNEDGSVTIPVDKVAQWRRQMNTDYADLSWIEQQLHKENVRTFTS